VRFEEGTSENGVFTSGGFGTGMKPGWGLNFGGEPVVLRVSVAIY
jgi:hypothetical protein